MDPRTPVKAKHSENSNPNVAGSSSVSKSPISKLAKSVHLKSASKCVRSPVNRVVVRTPGQKIRDRQFIFAKKKKAPNSDKEAGEVQSHINCKCQANLGSNPRKCVCVAYESLRASQEGFFKNQPTTKDGDADQEVMIPPTISEPGIEMESPIESNSPTLKRRREKLMHNARICLPESGKVKHLVKAFEEMLSVSEPEEQETNSNASLWALPGLHPPNSVSCFTLTSETLGLENFPVSSSCEGSNRRTSNGSRRSSDSCGTLGERRRRKGKNKRTTNLKPFRLVTEARGRVKEVEFSKKVQEMIMEEEKMRIPIAQGLPYTTDEPECLVKPQVKEATRPMDLKLNTDVRAVGRAEFNHQVAKKQTLMQHMKIEMEKEQKMMEEEEVRRLRKELIPKAQPMPYFDRPFVPRRSTKELTLPKEPKFHIAEQKVRCCLSDNNFQFQQL